MIERAGLSFTRTRCRPMPMKRALALALLAAFAACSEDGSPEAGDITRVDSAGVTIVTSPDRIGVVRRLAPNPRVSIGQLDGPEALQLYRVAGARRLSDGRIAIANAGSHEIRLYGPDGTHLVSAGSEGEGPGEFTAIAGFDASPEDSLFVWDQQQRRLTVLDPAGAFARDFQLEVPWERAFPSFTALFGDGTLMASIGELVSQPPGDGEVIRSEPLALRYDAEGQVVDTLATFLTRGALIRSFPDGGGFSIYTIPFDPGTLWAIAGRGVHVAHGPRFDVRTLDGTGAVARIARIARASVPVDEELREAAIDAELADYTNEDALRRAREAFEMMPFADSLPAYDELLSDEAGRVWARRHPLPGAEEAVWDVLDPTGALEAAITIPEAADIWQVGEDWVLLGEEDELEVERVALYELVDVEGG